MVNLAVLADVHFNDANGKRLYKELVDNFLELIEANKEVLDYIFIAGDYFDRKLSLDKAGSYYSIRFLEQLIHLANDNDIAVRMIVGTRTHDYNQPLLFSYLTERYDFKVFSTVTEEITKEGLRILYVPEEYPVDYKEYYKDYINDTQDYDIMVMHGMLDFTAHSSAINESEDNIQNSVCWPLKTVQRMAKLIVAGHVHTSHIKKNFCYAGSFSRWCYNEEEDKGWMWIEYDEATGNYEHTFITNEDAPVYNSLDLSVFRKSDDEDINIVINRIQRYVVKHGLPRLRIVVNGNMTEQLNNDLRVLREHVSTYKECSITIKRNTTSLKTTKVEDTAKQEENNALYKIATSPNLSLAERIHSVVELQYPNIILETTDIQDIIS